GPRSVPSARLRRVRTRALAQPEPPTRRPAAPSSALRGRRRERAGRRRQRSARGAACAGTPRRAVELEGTPRDRDRVPGADVALLPRARSLGRLHRLASTRVPPARRAADRFPVRSGDRGDVLLAEDRIRPRVRALLAREAARLHDGLARGREGTRGVRAAGHGRALEVPLDGRRARARRAPRVFALGRRPRRVVDVPLRPAARPSHSARRARRRGRARVGRGDTSAGGYASPARPRPRRAPPRRGGLARRAPREAALRGGEPDSAARSRLGRVPRGAKPELPPAGAAPRTEPRAS